MIISDAWQKLPTMMSSKTYLQCHMTIKTMEKIHVLSLTFQMKDPVLHAGNNLIPITNRFFAVDRHQGDL